MKKIVDQPVATATPTANFWSRTPFWLKIFAAIFVVVAVADFVLGFLDGIRS